MVQAQMRSGSAFHRIVHGRYVGASGTATPAKVVQNKNTHLQTASEHPPRPRLLGPTARAPSTSRPRPPRPATSLTVIYDSARRSPCAPPAPSAPRSAAPRPRHLPRPAWWPPPAAREGDSATPCRPPGDLSVTVTSDHKPVKGLYVYLPRRRAGDPGPRDNVHVLQAWPRSPAAAAAGATSAEPPWVGQGVARERI